MIVDDHAVFRRSLKMLLQKLYPGSTFCEAKNGKDFLEKISKKNIDLVIMDIQMPEMNGIEATKSAILKYPDLKILCISMFADLEDQIAIKYSGAFGFISKDQEFSTIVKAMTTVLKGKQYFPELDFHHL